jgi:hypothetical protein
LILVGSSSKIDMSPRVVIILRTFNVTGTGSTGTTVSIKHNKGDEDAQDDHRPR